MDPEEYAAMRDRIARLSATASALSVRVAKADGDSFVPPDGVRSAAARGLELRAKWKRGGLSNEQASAQGIGSGVQRAVNLKNGDAISLSTVRRMAAFFSRHQKNYRPDEKEKDGGPTAGTIAWLLWGGNAGKAWSESVLSRVEKKADDPRKTPAPPEDRVRGSDKNPEGSASNTRGGIEMSPAIEDSLRQKVDDHNARVSDEGRKADLGALKAVYRRGAGAYSTSHRPNVSRGAWAMARVNAYLKLLRSGRPESAAYVQDNDLLPEGHPRAKQRELL